MHNQCQQVPDVTKQTVVSQTHREIHGRNCGLLKLMPLGTRVCYIEINMYTVYVYGSCVCAILREQSLVSRNPLTLIE